MKIVVAPDAFKECLSAGEVAAAVASALGQALPGCETVELPVSDGGEGFVEVLTPALGGGIRTVEVSGPLGRPVRARYGVAGQTAVIEAAQACGLQLLRPEERHPLQTGTRGLGELLLEAAGRGCRHFLVGLGGSATCDGGAGMLSVPGVKELLREASIEVLCDVDNPFVGPSGAARVFAPQKGAGEQEVGMLEERMEAAAERMLAETGVDVSAVPGAGAAGGLGGAFLAYAGAALRNGIGRVLDLTGFDRELCGADLVITGEGKSDRQTLRGKAALGVLRRSGSVPVALLSGRIEDARALLDAGFRELVEVSPRELPLQEALRPDVAKKNLREAVWQKMINLAKQ